MSDHIIAQGSGIGGGISEMVDTDGVLTQTPLEARASIENLDALQARRRALVQRNKQLVERNKKLIAMHGPFGHYDNHRKRMVEAQKIAARLHPLDGIKVTDESVESMAYASDEYRKFTDEALSEKIKWVAVGAEMDEIQNEIAEIGERIRSREEEMRFVRAEMGLGG